jgi:hypothetical protein
VPDYLADLRTVFRLSGRSGLKLDSALRKIDKLERRIKLVGGSVNDQRQLCEVIAEAAQLANDSDPKAHDPKDWMVKLVFARLLRGDFSDWTGWEYRNDWAVKSYEPGIGERRWRLEKVKTLAVLGEQGIGDEIMFASCIPDVQKLGIDVVVECDPRLRSVLERSLGVKTRARGMKDEDTTAYLSKVREEDKFIPIGDLPRLFRKRLGDFPWEAYLTPLPEYVAKWSHLKGRTGLAWRGRTGKTEPEAFGIENPVCLQYDAWEFETEGMTVPDCDLRNDIEDLLGICANLERVVSVPQTIVHLAGSIGTHVEVVLPPAGSSRVRNDIPWRYLDPMPWYPNVRVHANVGNYRGARSKLERGRARSGD